LLEEIDPLSDQSYAPSASNAANMPNGLAAVPFSQEAEEAVIGAVLMNPDAFLSVASFLQSDDFYILRNGYIWEAFQRISSRNEIIDYLITQEELENQGRLKEIGGPAYLTHLMNSTPTSMHAEVYGHLVERAATRRRLLLAADEIKGLALDEEKPIEQVTGDAESRLFKVTERNIRRDLIPLHEAVSAYFDRIEFLMRNQNEPLGLPTGFRDLDELLAGLQKSDLLIFAGRPGAGKTSFLLSVALNAARIGARIGIFTMEMGNEQIVQRLVSMDTGIDSQKLRTGRLEAKEWSKFVEATGRLSNLHLFVDDTPAMTPIQMRTKCRRLVHEYGLDLVIVDYLQLMNAGGSYENNRVQEVSYISRALKEMARELNVPVFTAAQLSRAVEQRHDKRPVLSDLRESGCLAGDSLVYLPDTGMSVPIRDLAGKSGFNVLSLNTNTWKLEPAEVSNAFCTGVKPVYRMTTRLGRTIRATGNHKFLTVCGWKRLDELTTDDHVAVPRILYGPSEQTMSDAELALLGHLLGDGCTLPRHAIQYTTREEDLAETVTALATEVFGDKVKPRIYKEPGHNWYQVFLAATERLTHGVHNPVQVWMEELGVYGLRSYEKFVPDKVFQQPPQAIARFLRHLWATDGSIGMKKVSSGIYPSVFYASSSAKLAHGVQALLVRLGINALIRIVPQIGKGRDQYNVVLGGKADLEAFADRIGAVGNYRNERLQIVEQHLSAHTTSSKRDFIPGNIWANIITPAMETAGISQGELRWKVAIQNRDFGKNASRERAAQIAEVVHSQELSKLAYSDVYWDEIASIEPDGETEVYDLTVPSVSNFIGNLFTTHNSIEQDADIVMFLYRDVVYNPETEFPNAAEIIIAKHRNGPTGTIQLHFEKSLTKFSDARTQTIDLSSL
jgi:replicative DNA helicase